MYLLKSISTTASAGKLTTVVITASLATNIQVTYDGVLVLDTTAITGTYTFDFIPTTSNGIISLYIDTKSTGTISVVYKVPYYHNLLNNGAGVIKFKEDKNGWTSFVRFSPERMATANDFLYSFKDGAIHKHDNTTKTFFGAEYDSVIGFRVAGNDGVIKILDYISVESNIKPKYVHVVAVNPYSQATDLCASDFVYLEGTFYSSFFNDKLSPDFVNPSESVNYAEALINGDAMRAKWFDVFMIFDNEEDFVLSSVNFGVTTSTGHKK